MELVQFIYLFIYLFKGDDFIYLFNKFFISDFGEDILLAIKTALIIAIPGGTAYWYLYDPWPEGTYRKRDFLTGKVFLIVIKILLGR